MSKNAIRHRQQKLSQAEKDKIIKSKFLTPIDDNEAFQYQQAVPKFVPATQNQRLQLCYLQEGRSVVWAIGAAGSGKSMVAAYHAATLLKQKKIDKVLLVRPAVAVGSSLGLLPGGLVEKLEPWFKQTVAHLEKFLGKGHTRYCLDKGIIEYQAMEHLRGHSFENVFVICEESQGLKEDEYEMMLTRIGNGGQICFTGDERQAAVKDKSGLTDLITMIHDALYYQYSYLDKEDLDVLRNDIGIVKYTIDDIQRSGVVKLFCKMYYHKK